MSNLVRVQTGPFTLADAIRVDDLEELLRTSPWEEIAWHPDAVMHDWPALILDDAGAVNWRQGKSVEHEGNHDNVRVYDSSGTWLGVGQSDEAGTQVRPIKVVAEE
jgi:tRNA U55 pseudouridine synthase TruB